MRENYNFFFLLKLFFTQDPWGAWEHKFKFYAFPAEHVLLSPDLEGSDMQDVDSGS